MFNYVCVKVCSKGSVLPGVYNKAGRRVLWGPTYRIPAQTKTQNYSEEDQWE